MDQAGKIDLLENQNQNLRLELDQLREQNQALWLLLNILSRRLQSAMASIKAASSSLLDHQIFWDASTQYEFLKTIDQSVDQGSRLVTLLGLTLKSGTENLIINPEPHMLQEILVSVHEGFSGRFPNIDLNLMMPPDGHPVLVDYEYLTLALSLLLEVLVEQHIQGQAKFIAEEQDKNWRLEIQGAEPEVFKLLMEYYDCQKNKVFPVDWLAAENVLKLYIIARIFCQSGVVPKMESGNGKIASLYLTIPSYTQEPVMIPDPIH